MTISLWHLSLVIASALLFLAVTLLAAMAGMFQSPGKDDPGGAIKDGAIVFLYGVFWVLPSLIAWAAWDLL